MSSVGAVQDCDLKALAGELKASEPYRRLAEVNGTTLALEVIDGDLGWHRHDDMDEASVVVDCRMRVELPSDEHHVLEPGTLFVVPRGVAQPVGDPVAVVLLSELAGAAPAVARGPAVPG